ncbi:MAG: DUF1015 domain-containing protein [Cyclonatronaceae bacterium]
MITIKPFQPWRPDPKHIEEVACVPYDVIDVEEARALAEGRPKSFLHVIRPEIDLPEDTDSHADAVYAKGAENLKALIESGELQHEPEPALYVYRLVWKGRSQTGLFSCVSVRDYDEDRILKHELTRPDKEDDRTRHLIEQQAHAEPVMLTCRGSEAISREMKRITENRGPLFDFKASDGVQHTLWKVADYDGLHQAFSELNALYVADGHHRCKSASRLAEHERAQNPDSTGEEAWNYFPAVIFPKEEMEILPYNRVIHKVAPETFTRLKTELKLEPTGTPSPSTKGQVCAYYDGIWYQFRLPEPVFGKVADTLDAARLQKSVFEPYFGIENPRTDTNISFIGGIRGTQELERLVDSGKAELAFSVYATSIQELMDVSDAGELMPPKSTWFEPKLRSGLLVHKV